MMHADIKAHLWRIRVGLGHTKACKGPCGEQKLFTEFHKEKRGTYGVRSDCKKCCSANRAARSRQRRKDNPEAERLKQRDYLRKAYTENRNGIRQYIRSQKVARRARLKSPPTWTSWAELKDVYIKTRELQITTGVLHETDHIYPLQGKTVTGLHCPSNMRALPRSINQAKGNKLPGDLQHELWTDDPVEVFYG